jgi:hypothetical protein
MPSSEPIRQGVELELAINKGENDMKIKSGGGIQSNKYVTSKAGKSEPISHKVSVPAAAQLGRSEQFRKTPLEAGRGYTPRAMGPTGVRGTFNSASQGPGSGRTIHPSGSQSPTPQAREMPKGRDTLSEYGRDIPGRR